VLLLFVDLRLQMFSIPLHLGQTHPGLGHLPSRVVQRGLDDRVSRPQHSARRTKHATLKTQRFVPSAALPADLSVALIGQTLMDRTA
jgi:hypothetical protein